MVSICIPTYNKPRELRRLLDSIARQTFKDFEVIISDDTPDPDIIERVLVDYAQLPVRYFHHAEPLGSPRNWNFALNQAQGDYAKLMHDDDWFTEDNALQVMANTIEQTGTDIVWCKSQNFRDGKVVSTNSTNKEQLQALHKDPFCLFSGNFMSAPSATLVRTSALRYDEHVKWFVDIEYYIHLLKDGKFAYVDKSLVGINNDLGRVTDECITNAKMINSEFFYCWRKLRREGIISFPQSLRGLYRFVTRNHDSN